MFENHSDPLLPYNRFVGRILRGLWIVLGLVGVSLLMGMIGYRFLADMNWIDAFYNAALIMSGMGPADAMHSNAAKIFAGLYSIYSGLILIAAMGILLVPVLHRMMHKFHQPTD